MIAILAKLPGAPPIFTTDTGMSKELIKSKIPKHRIHFER